MVRICLVFRADCESVWPVLQEFDSFPSLYTARSPYHCYLVGFGPYVVEIKAGIWPELD